MWTKARDESESERERERERENRPIDDASLGLLTNNLFNSHTANKHQTQPNLPCACPWGKRQFCLPLCLCQTSKGSPLSSFLPSISSSPHLLLPSQSISFCITYVTYAPAPLFTYLNHLYYEALVKNPTRILYYFILASGSLGV